MEQLALLNGSPTTPAPARPRCRYCGAGFVRPGLGDGSRQRVWAEEWARLIDDQPRLADQVRQIALELSRQQTGLLSVDRVWTEYRARWKVALDHNHRAAAARWLMKVEPELAGRYRIRDVKGAPHARRRSA